MKYLTIIALLLLTGCGDTLPELCRHIVLSQHAAAVEKYGAENVETWRLKNSNPKPYKYHAQVKVRPGGPDSQWFWIPNQQREEFLHKCPQKGCTPYERIK